MEFDQFFRFNFNIKIKILFQKGDKSPRGEEYGLRSNLSSSANYSSFGGKISKKALPERAEVVVGNYRY